MNNLWRFTPCQENNNEYKQAVLATIEEYANAYYAKDINRLTALFAENEEISVIGTVGLDEFCSGPEEIRDLFLRNFSEATASSLERHWQRITVSNESI